MQSSTNQATPATMEAFMLQFRYYERFHANVSRMIEDFLETSGSRSIAGAINNHLIAASQSIDMSLNTEAYAHELIEEVEEQSDRIAEYHEECLMNFNEAQDLQMELGECKKKLEDRDKEVMELKEKLLEKERTIEVMTVMNSILNEVTESKVREEEVQMTASQSEASEEVEEVRPESTESVNGESTKRKDQYGCGHCAVPSTSTSTTQPPEEESDNLHEHGAISVIQCQSSKAPNPIGDSRPSTSFIGPLLPKELQSIRSSEECQEDLVGSVFIGPQLPKLNRKRRWDVEGQMAPTHQTNHEDVDFGLPRCMFCYGNHIYSDCRVYRTLDEKLYKAAALQLCIKCLNRHFNKPCPSNRPCSHCKEESHNMIFCPKYKQK